MEDFDERRIVIVELDKGPSGFGFNIVGGSNSQHIPGDTGIFITKIRPKGSAYNDGQLCEGDRLISVNDESLLDVTHEQAVDVFRRAKGKVKLTAELHGERRAIERPPSGLKSTSTSSSSRSPASVGGALGTGHVTSLSANHITNKYKATNVDTLRSLSQASSRASLVAAEEQNLSSCTASDSLVTNTVTWSTSSDKRPMTSSTANSKKPSPSAPNPAFPAPIPSSANNQSPSIPGKRGGATPERGGTNNGNGISESSRLIEDEEEQSRDKNTRVKYYVQEMTYTFVGLAAITGIGFLIYRRFCRGK